MIALEALKNSVAKLTESHQSLDSLIKVQQGQVERNSQDIYKTKADVLESQQLIAGRQDRMDKLRSDSRATENQLYDSRGALVLYCQQFAFSAEIAPACAALLTCKDTHLPYHYFSY